MQTILIVDDDPALRKYLGSVLKKEGFDVIEAENGNECLRQAQVASPKVVVLDIVMPEKDGIAVIPEIKAMSDSTKIIAISGGDFFIPETYLEEAKAIGADYIMQKPIDRAEFVDVIKEAIDS